MKTFMKELGNPASLLSGMMLFLVCLGLAPINGLWSDLASHFMLQYTLGALVLAVLAAVLRSARGVYVILALSFCLSFHQLVPFLPLGKAEAVQGKTLKVLNANVLWVNKEPDRLGDLIAQENPDIVVTQEVSISFAQKLQSLRKQYPHQSLYPEEKGPRGLAVISKIPFDKIERIYFDNENIPSHFFRLRHEGKTFTFLSIHPFTPTQDIERRDSEFRLIAERFKKTPQKNFVLLGDFNASPFCQAYKQLAKELQLKNAREGRGFMPTWPSYFALPVFRIPIDHALVGENISVHDFRVGNSIGSDHLPFIVELKAKS